MSGAEMIAVERQRQVDAEGFTAEHDQGHAAGDLVAAARCYALFGWWLALGDACGWSRGQVDDIVLETDSPEWPWDESEWKPVDADPVRNLVKAGALIAAEIDRINASSTSLGEASP